MKKISLMIIGILLTVVVAGCGGKDPNIEEIQPSWDKVIVFKSPSCGCCVGYVAELRDHGYTVETVELVDMSPVKAKYNVPLEMQSCHTAVIGDYFIEGHVPMEAVEKMLNERPDIDGIALPRMPAGSPGMPGTKTQPFKVLALSGGSASEYVTI